MTDNEAVKTAEATEVDVKNLVNCISDDLCRALAIAAIAHDNQVDKGMCDYILHPITVMMSMTTKEEKIAAILHDVVEDSEITIDNLIQWGFSLSIINALKLLTRNKGVKYQEYIKNISQHNIARKVKIADLEHNMDIRRISTLNEYTFKRLTKYQIAWTDLTTS